MLIVAGLVIIFGVTAATAFFVAQEFAFVAVERSRLQQLAETGDHAAEAALRVTQRLSFMLSGAQLGITVTALFVGFFAQPYLGSGLSDWLGGTAIPTAVSTVIAATVALLVANIAQMVLGELTPKNLAIAKTTALARWLARPTLAYLAVAGPFIKFFDAAANRVLRLFGIEPLEELPHGASPDDLHHIIEDSHGSGRLSAELAAILGNGLDFRQLTANEVMTHRVDVETVQADATISQLVDRLASGRSRFPVIAAGIDDVIGIVGIAEVVTVPRDQRAHKRVRDIAATPLLLPESLPMPEVLEQLRGQHRQQACIIDEYGGFAGIVTFEDAAEELVGDIRDEDDKPAQRPMRRSDGSWLAPARWRLDEIADATGIRLDGADEHETLGGLVMRRLGRIPKPGDAVSVGVQWNELSESESLATIPEVHLEVTTVQRHVPSRVIVRLVGTVGDPEVRA